MQLNPIVRTCLGKASIEVVGDLFHMKTKDKLSRANYLQFISVVHGLRGEWVRKVNAHIFQSDPSFEIEAIVSSGILPTYCLNPHSFFPTPLSEVREAIALADIKDYYEGVKVLEPSAGDGRFIREILKVCPKADVRYFEIDERNRSICSNLAAKFLGEDFLNSEPTGNFDFVLMNPPFNKKEYQKHIRHAAKFLKDGGVMVSVMPSSVVNDRTFRDWMFGEMNGMTYPMDEAFEDTKVNTIMVRMTKGRFIAPTGYSSYSNYQASMSLENDFKFCDATKNIASFDKMIVAIETAIDRLVRSGESLCCTPEDAIWLAKYFCEQDDQTFEIDIPIEPKQLMLI